MMIGSHSVVIPWVPLNRSLPKVHFLPNPLLSLVFYDDDLTNALFNTLSRLVHRLKNACTAIFSVEKR